MQSNSVKFRHYRAPKIKVVEAALNFMVSSGGPTPGGTETPIDEDL